MSLLSIDDQVMLHQHPAELLQALLRCDTTNPPGNEAACVAYLDRLLKDSGVDTRIVARDPARPNLISRLPGAGNAPPLLLYGHVDVVTTAGQRWTYPLRRDGGTLDMKGGVAMLVAAFLRARAEGLML